LGAIVESAPFPQLPSAFTGSCLALRFRFLYNPDESDLASSPSKSATKISISLSGDNLEVPVGGSKAVTATVTGTQDNTVEWSVSGSGCAGFCVWQDGEWSV
jgi:hypothetical protein